MLTPILPSSKIIKKKRIRAPIWCTITGCKRKFQCAAKLKAHMDYAHNKIYNNVCDHVDDKGQICGMKFEQSTHLTQHRKKHDPKLRLICDLCNRIFLSLVN